MRQVYENGKDQGAVIPPEYIEPPFPQKMRYLWEWFFDISSTRQFTENGPARISRVEIAQWESDEGVRLDRWERRALMNLDALFVASFHKDIALG